MSYGRLAVADLPATTNTQIYAAPNNCLHADVNINVLNTTNAAVTLRLAIATTTTPNAEEYIRDSVSIAANGGLLEVNNVCMSANEKIIGHASAIGLVVRVSGKEQVS